MKQRCLALLFAAPLLLSSPAWALFDAQVLTGKRNSEFGRGSVSAKEEGRELKAAAHLDPIPLVPVSFGLSASQNTWDASDTFGYKSFDGFELGLEVEAWLPLQLAGFEPYAKLGYTVAGAYVATVGTALGDYKMAYKPSGLYVAAGLRYNILLRLGVMLELEQGNRTLAFDEFKDLPGGISDQVKSELSAKSQSVLFGVRAGI